MTSVGSPRVHRDPGRRRAPRSALRPDARGHGRRMGVDPRDSGHPRPPGRGDRQARAEAEPCCPRHTGDWPDGRRLPRPRHRRREPHRRRHRRLDRPPRCCAQSRGVRDGTGPRSRLAHWTGDDSQRDEAEGHLAATLSGFGAAGIRADGQVGPDDPIQAADDGLRTFPADELVFVRPAAMTRTGSSAGHQRRARAIRRSHHAHRRRSGRLVARRSLKLT